MRSKVKDFWLILAMVALIVTVATMKGKAQVIDHTRNLQHLVDRFYEDGRIRGVDLKQQKVTILIAPLNNPEANGRVETLGDGSIRILIDKEFYKHFQYGPQVTRLLYYLLGHEVLGKGPGKRIMNDNLVYVKMSKRAINKLFA